MVMQNLNVLYVPGPQIKTDKTDGIIPAPPPGDPISVTFEVTPEQAQALIFMLAVKDGQIQHDPARAQGSIGDQDQAVRGRGLLLGNFQKVQKTTDKSIARVQELAAAN